MDHLWSNLCPKGIVKNKTAVSQQSVELILGKIKKQNRERALTKPVTPRQMCTCPRLNPLRNNIRVLTPKNYKIELNKVYLNGKIHHVHEPENFNVIKMAIFPH